MKFSADGEVLWRKTLTWRASPILSAWKRDLGKCKTKLPPKALFNTRLDAQSEQLRKEWERRINQLVTWLILAAIALGGLIIAT